MTYRFKIPEKWGLSPQQITVIELLMLNPGKYVSSLELCYELYDEKTTGPAPAKLRMLVQRCRDILYDKVGSRVPIVGRRNSGWKITRKGAMFFSRFLDN